MEHQLLALCPNNCLCRLRISSLQPPFYFPPHAPYNLMGLDFLKYFHTTIHCSPSGVRVIFGKKTLPKQYNFSSCSDLDFVPACVWATADTDVGRKDISPLHIQVREDASLPRIPQYKISREGEDALISIIDDMIRTGVVEEVSFNVCNSPILPILKRGDGTGDKIYRFVIDLREVNKIVILNILSSLILQLC